AYGLGVFDRLAGMEGGGLRALVVTVSDVAAERIALSLARLGGPAGVSVAAVGPGWAQGTPQVVVASAETALREVEASRLKLETLESFVLDSASVMLALSGNDVIEALTVSLPREAQRVVVTAEATPQVESYIERHVRRALWIPGRPVVTEEVPPPRGVLSYAVAPEGGKAELLAGLVAGGRVNLPAAVHCRAPASAAAAREALELRGFRASDPEPGLAPGSAVFRLALRDGDVSAAGGVATVVSYDVPFDAASLGERHAAGGVVLALARALPHLRQLAADAQLALDAVSAAHTTTARRELGADRARVPQAGTAGDRAARPDARAGGRGSVPRRRRAAVGAAVRECGAARQRAAGRPGRRDHGRGRHHGRRGGADRDPGHLLHRRGRGGRGGAGDPGAER